VTLPMIEPILRQGLLMFFLQFSNFFPNFFYNLSYIIFISCTLFIYFFHAFFQLLLIWIPGRAAKP